MPDLGPYAAWVLSAYAVSILLLAVLVGASLVKSRRAKAELDRTEGRDG